MQIKEKPGMVDESITLDEIQVPKILQRKSVDEAKIAELAQSIQNVGLINRIVVKKTKVGYELVAGYRRYLALIRLKETVVDARVIVQERVSSEEITLDENYAREDITPVEEALWFAEIENKFSISRADLGKKLGKNRSYISERFAILEYDDVVIEALQQKQIGLKMAQTLMKCRDGAERNKILSTVLNQGANTGMVKYWVQQANLEMDRPDTAVEDEMFTENANREYVAPLQFCDLCEQETNYMESKFIRCCPRCWEVSKQNLKPESREIPARK